MRQLSIHRLLIWFTRGLAAALMIGALNLSASVAEDAAPGKDLAAAGKLWLKGRYEEAEAAFRRLQAAEPVAAARGLAKCFSSTGRADEAEKLLGELQAASGNVAELTADLASLALERGDHDAAKKLAEEALKQDADQLAARWVLAEVARGAGRLDDADKLFAGFIDFYNQHDKFTAEQLHFVGLAAAEYARWHRNSRQFRFLVNTLYPDALKLEPDYWPARLESALLFAEKYNEADAKAELDAALAINANAAEVHAVRGLLAMQTFDLPAARASIERALKINPRLLLAHQVHADILLADLQPASAIDILEKARELNPRHEGPLGRLAAAYGAVDGLVNPPADSRLGRLIAEVTARNPACGEFFMAFGDSLDRMRKYPFAAEQYAEAERRMPRMLYVRGQLGLVYMRLGEEVQAAKLLEDAFKADPFNVRVKNMLEVLDVLKGYAVLETEHFVIRFDRGADEILAKEAARFLEAEVYPATVKSLGYEPAGKTLFEIFSKAKNSSGHSWFSARMVGLPFIGTVGACAGQMVAITSPNDMPKKFNWARVMRHEFVHVVNLQQTKFNIPHWYTEALAVRHEGQKRPKAWLEVLAARTKEDSLFDLGTINLGFIRPKDQDDWTLAYCQAELYADFMVAAFGDDSLAKLLAAYAENLDTPAAIRRCFQIEIDEFERRYREHLEKVLGDFRPATAVEPQRSLAEWKAAAEKSPEDATLQAGLAAAYLERNDLPNARKTALAARQLDPKQAKAAFVLARVVLSIGDQEQAVQLLEDSLDEAAPDEAALHLLASLKLKAEAFDAAERLFRLGQEKFPRSDRWEKSLSSLYLKTGDKAKLAVSLARLAEDDPDNGLLCKKLAQLAVEAADFDAAIRWATQAIQIDVMDAETHALLGSTFRVREQADRAIEHLETALRIQPQQLDWQVLLAETFVETKQPEKARELLQAVLRERPDDEAAEALLKSLERAK